MAMLHNQAADHLQAMNKIQDLMKDPKAIQNWFEAKKHQFEVLPESWPIMPRYIGNIKQLQSALL
jgi:hypothetical protein